MLLDEASLLPRPRLTQEYKTITAQLPSHIVLRELVDAYFSEANWHFQVLERYYFDEIFAAWLGTSCVESILEDQRSGQREILHFPALLFQVLAVAIQFLPPDTTASRTLQLTDTSAYRSISQRYSNLGEALMASLGRWGSTVTGIQHDMMKSLWFKTNGRGLASWQALGNAIR